MFYKFVVLNQKFKSWSLHFQLEGSSALGKTASACLYSILYGIDEHFSNEY